MMALLLLWAWTSVAAAQAPAVAPALDEQVSKARSALRPIYQDEDADESSYGVDGPVALPNFGRVSAAIYRSGQPNREGLRQVRGLGTRSVLVLRKKVGPEEREEVGRLGMGLAHVPLTGIFSPTYESVDRALAVLTDPALQPLLVHCRFGKDRTGVVVAAYRVVFEDMPIAQAAAEARKFHCCTPLFRPLEGYLKGYLEHRRKTTIP